MKVKISENKYVLNTITIVIISYVCIFLYAFNTISVIDFLKVFSLIVLISISCFVFGGALGFLFGIPNHKDADMNDRFERNTSLRQISDWLTKIIVGITLVELKNIFNFFKQTVLIISKLINTDLSINVLVAVIIIEFIIIGFVLIYILTITVFFKDLVDSDNTILTLLSNLNLDPSDMKITDLIEDDSKFISEEKKSQILKYVSKNGIKVDNIYLAKRLAKILYQMKEYSNSAAAYSWAFNLNNDDISLKINEAFIRSKFLKQFESSNSILKELISKNNNLAIPFYNIACNFNRELRDLINNSINDESYILNLRKEVENNLREAFLRDRGLYIEAIKDSELDGIDIKSIFNGIERNE